MSSSGSQVTLCFPDVSYHDDYLTSDVYTISVTRRTVRLLVPVCTSPTSTRNHLADGDGPDGEAYVGDGAGHVLDGRACPDEFTPIK